MPFTKIVKPRRHTPTGWVAKPPVEPRTKGRADRPILHLKTQTAD